MGSYQRPFGPSGVMNDTFVYNNHLYIAARNGGLKICDVTDPLNMSYVSTFGTSYAERVFISNNYAYIADNWDGLRVINISTPSAPVYAGARDTDSYAHGVHVSGTIAAIADDWTGIRLMDVSNPASPQNLGSYDSTDATAVQIEGDYLYTADGDGNEPL